MKQKAKSRASMLGVRFGLIWKRYMRFLRWVSAWLSNIGLRSDVVRMILCMLQIAAVGFFVFCASWIVVIGVIMVLGGLGLFTSTERTGDFDAQWREGTSGFGLYDATGTRIDPYDPDE